MDRTDFPTGSLAPEARAVFPPRVERLVKLSWLALLWEDVWPRLWPAWGFAALYLSAGLFGAFAAVPAWAHALAFAAAAIGLCVTLWLSFRGMAWPARDAALHRLDLSVDLARRAAAAYDDRLASDPDDPFARTVWQEYRARLFRRLGELRAHWPRSRLSARDPHALRAGALLLLAVAFASAGSDWPSRLGAAFAPDLRSKSLLAAKLDAWATPPDYTDEAPIFLASSADAPVLPLSGAVTLPAGSEVQVRVQGGGSAPRASLAGRDVAAFQETAPDVYEMTLTVSDGGDLKVSIGGARLATWSILVKPDIAPAVEFTATPGPTPQAATRFAYTGGDDYGITGVLVRLRLAAKPGETLPDDSPVLELPLSVPGAPSKALETETSIDLTAHHWAGLAVTAQLEAADQAGQKGLSMVETFVLPARRFAHPLAKALVEQRRELAPKSADVGRVVRFLDAFTAAPESYFENIGVFLGIRAARHRLVQARDRADVDSAMAMLWDIAVRLEDGGLSEAAERLRQVQQELQQELQNDNATDADIARLMAELRQAMADYMNQLAQNAPQVNAPMPPGGQALTQDDLQKLMDAIEELSQQGARELAQQLLSELRQMLENLQAAGPMQMTPQQRAMNEAIGQLGELIDKQRALMDETFRAQQDGAPSSQGLQERQEGLRAELGEITKGLGQPGEGAPPGLGRADRSMQGAGEDIGEGRMGSAVDQQKDALREMQDSAQQMSQQLMQQLQAQGGVGLGAQGMQQPGQDPLGRRNGQGGFDGQAVKIPEQMDLQRARIILEELRRRAAERGRPQNELDYLDRLLRRF